MGILGKKNNGLHTEEIELSLLQTSVHYWSLTPTLIDSTNVERLNFAFWIKPKRKCKYLSRVKKRAIPWRIWPCQIIASTSILWILIFTGILSTSAHRVLDTFRPLYSSLYNSNGTICWLNFVITWGTVFFPSLPPQARLDNPISTDEIEFAISQLPSHKTLGLDDCQAECYVKLKPSPQFTSP